MELPRRPTLPLVAGQTLVEVLIAATIMVTALMASVRNQVSSVLLLKSSRETELATELLNEAMAQAFLESNAELVGEDGTHAPGVPIVMQQLLMDQDLRYTLPDVVGGEVPAFLEVRFQLSWTSYSGHQRTLGLSGGKR